MKNLIINQLSEEEYEFLFEDFQFYISITKDGIILDIFKDSDHIESMFVSSFLEGVEEIFNYLKDNN